MRYRVTRIIVMFYITMKTDKDIREYTQFRKFLIKNGFLMMQYSIYAKICSNHSQANIYMLIK
ncbi:MAG: CRISPR-associated endonuclease Cas2 [Bacilli bacterium]